MTLLLIVVLASFGLYVMSPEQRAELLRRVVTTLRQGAHIATRRHAELDALRATLAARLRWPIATPALATLNVIVFVAMLRGDGALADPDTVVAWGGSIGPLTTNGVGWWRLIGSTFVHSGFLQLVINVAMLVQIGRLLEPLVGPLALAGVYAAAGMFASLVSISSYPIVVNNGASGAIFGLFGLLVTTMAWGLWAIYRHAKAAEREGGTSFVHATTATDEAGAPHITIPLAALKPLAPLAGVFFLFNMVNGSLPFSAELAGFLVGLIGGTAVGKDTATCPSPSRRVGIAMACAGVMAVAFAVPLYGISDVKPEIARVLALEDRTTRGYQAAVDQVRTGRVNADALAMLIERTIVPELQAANARLKALKNVPPEHQEVVTDAEEYLKLRSESWHLRAEGLRKINVRAARNDAVTDASADTNFRLQAEAQFRSRQIILGKAEGAERASLEAFEKIKTNEPK